MGRKSRTVIEYRSYALPVSFPLMVLTGDSWHISDIPSKRLHFHNCLEIGMCHDRLMLARCGNEHNGGNVDKHCHRYAMSVQSATVTNPLGHYFVHVAHCRSWGHRHP